MSSIPSKDRERIIRNVCKLVLTKHFNIGQIDLATWAEQAEQKLPQLISADQDAFENGVRGLLTELGTSHTAFYSNLPQLFPPQHTLNATISRKSEVADQWVFVDVFEGGPAAAAGIVPGDVLIAVDGGKCSSEPPRFRIGAQHQLTLQTTGQITRDVSVQVPARKPTKARPPIVEPKPISFRLLNGGVALLRIVYFPGAFGMRFGQELDTAMEQIRTAGCERLVLDLRGNIGGSLGFARVASYLCPDVVPIGHSLTPQRLRAGYRADELPKVIMPSNRINLLTTLGRFAFADKSVMLMTSGFGSQSFHGRIVVLVNEWTNSAGEMLAAFAQQQTGAKVIGERTRGNVLGAGNFNVGNGYWLRIPIFGWYTAKGQTLEGTGVTPDIPVAATQLVRGIDDQLIAAERVIRNAF